MTKRMMFSAFLILLLVVGCNKTTKNENMQEQTETELVKPLNLDTMTIEQIGAEFGKIAGESYMYVVDLLKKSPELSDAQKEELKKKRIKAYTNLPPMIKKINSLSDEEKSQVAFGILMEFMEIVPDIEGLSKEMEGSLDALEKDKDQEYAKDIAALISSITFLGDSDSEDEDFKMLKKHVGLE